MIRAVYRKDPLQLRNDMELSNWQLDPTLAPDVFVSQSAAAAKRIGFGHPSTMLPPGTTPPAFRKPSTSKPAKK